MQQRPRLQGRCKGELSFCLACQRGCRSRWRSAVHCRTQERLSRFQLWPHQFAYELHRAWKAGKIGPHVTRLIRQDADFCRSKVENSEVRRDVRQKVADACGEVRATRPTQRWLGIRREQQWRHSRKEHPRTLRSGPQACRTPLHSTAQRSQKAEAAQERVTPRDVLQIYSRITID